MTPIQCLEHPWLADSAAESSGAGSEIGGVTPSAGGAATCGVPELLSDTAARSDDETDESFFPPNSAAELHSSREQNVLCDAASAKVLVSSESCSTSSELGTYEQQQP